MASSKLVLAVAATLLAAAAAPGPADADPLKCQKRVVSQLFRLKRVHLSTHIKCLDKENKGDLAGPCPDTTAQLKIQKVALQIPIKIADACQMADLAAIGYRSDCAYEAATGGVEAQCAALPVTTPQEFAQCLMCWKSAELGELIALLFASHAVEVCGSLDETSSTCSDLDCTTPLPVQHNLGDTGENDCQRAIAKAAYRYVIVREKLLEKCALAGITRAACLADLVVQEKLATAEAKKANTINNKCGNRVPVPNPPFCCRTGTGNACTAAASRDDCVMNLAGQVQEDKTCNAGSCQPVGGPNKPITWWDNCPESNTCPGTALSTIGDVIACVDTSADAIVDELLCLQFPANGGSDWPCPPEAGP